MWYLQLPNQFEIISLTQNFYWNFILIRLQLLQLII